MAIERTTINGDATALKNALDTLVPAFFAEVTATAGSSSSTAFACKDADGNTLLSFTYLPNMTTTEYRIYRDSTHYLGANISQSKVSYFFKVGANGAFLQLTSGGVIAIAKAANGKTAITIPAVQNKATSIYAACWGDDTAYDKPLKFADDTNPMIGNNVQFVPVPLYGNYQLSNNIPKVFYMPMAQSNMRGIVQEVTSESGTYITDGYIAMIDDGSEE